LNSLEKDTLFHVPGFQRDVEGRFDDGMKVWVLFQHLEFRLSAFSRPCPQRKLKGEGAPSKTVTLDADMSLMGLDGHLTKSESKTSQ
jgi:hypothetical protein